MTAKEARETRIFVIEIYDEVYEPCFAAKKDGNLVGLSGNDKQYWESKGYSQVIQVQSKLKDYYYKIEETNLNDFVMLSAKETTSPRGVENVLHIRERENEESIEYQVWDWGFRGQYPRMVESFETEEEAEDYIFNATYNYDFERDDQRNTCYYASLEEAQTEMIRMYADNKNIDITVAESIFRHKECYKKIKAVKDAEHAEKQREWFRKENERIQAIAPIYAKIIEKIEGESYKQTCTRLSQAIGEKIEGKVFHAAVKIIRK